MSTTTRKTFPPTPNHVTGAAAVLPVEHAALVGAPVTPAKSIPEIPLVSAVLFRSPDGQTWRLRISPTGTLLIDPAP
jgi:hypothetical protein